MINKQYKSIHKHRVQNTDDSRTPEGWIRFRRQSYRVKGKLLRWLETFVTGNYAIGPKYIIFEKDVDAVLFKLKYPSR